MTSPVRTTCACPACVACCTTQPGPLRPGDFELIADHLGVTPDAAKVYFWASPGAVLASRATGETMRIGTITPRLELGRCVFLDAQDRCRIHPVAPFGCAYFDTHQDLGASRALSMVYLNEIMRAPEYRALRATLPSATSWKPRIAI